MTAAQNTEKLVKVAVVTGGHSYDVPNFHRLFRSLEGIDAYIQHVDDFCSSTEEVRDSYDVVLFYTMMTKPPTDEGLPWYSGKPKTALEHLGETEQGIVVLHHAILSHQGWPNWNQIVGIEDRNLSSFHIGETVNVQVASAEHPITRGMSGWEMVDETYVMKDAGEDNKVLLTTDHPSSMRTIAWTTHYRNARVFCCELGHDNRAWSNPGFRKVLTRGIDWAAK